MPTAGTAQFDQLGNHDLKKLVEVTTSLLKVSAVQGINAAMSPGVYALRPGPLTVGGRATAQVPSVAAVVAARVKALDPARQNTVRLALGRDASITAAIRTFSVDVRSAKRVTEQANLGALYAFVNDRTFGEAAVARMAADLAGAPLAAGLPAGTGLATELRALDVRYGRVLPAGWLDDLVARAASGGGIVLNRGLKFRVHQVKCIDETNPEWPGSDEISWGGTAVDDKGVASIIAEKKVGGGFDDGDVKSYNPPEILKTFPLDATYPKEFMVALALAEKDSGGMSEFIRQLYEAIKGEITKILEVLGAAAGAYIGTQIGGSIGTAIGGPLGTIIGAAAGAILGALVGWLIGALSDDIFPPQAAAVFLGTPEDTFANGSLVSPTMYLHYRDHGGHYRVKYDWEITR